MDFIKNAVNSAKGGEQKPAAGNAAGNTAGNTASGSGQQDYVDKAFGMASKKAGHPMDANTSEKITDAGRNMYEKATGKKVDPKWSN